MKGFKGLGVQAFRVGLGRLGFQAFGLFRVLPKSVTGSMHAMQTAFRAAREDQMPCETLLLAFAETAREILFHGRCISLSRTLRQQSRPLPGCLSTGRCTLPRQLQGRGSMVWGLRR